MRQMFVTDLKLNKNKILLKNAACTYGIKAKLNILMTKSRLYLPKLAIENTEMQYTT